jgi:hypothetical protein
MAIDWEEFKKQTAELNKGRTEEERQQSFIRAAKSSWRFYKVYHWRNCIKKARVNGNDLYEPFRLERICAFKFKELLYIKAYTALLLQATDGKGVYPVKRDDETIRLRDRVLEIRAASETEMMQEYSVMFKCSIGLKK